MPKTLKESRYTLNKHKSKNKPIIQNVSSSYSLPQNLQTFNWKF